MHRDSTAAALTCLTALLVAAACSPDTVMHRIVPRETDARARAYLALLTRHHPDSAQARLLPEIAGPEAQRTILQLDSILGGQRFDSVRMIGAQINDIAGVRHSNLVYELHAQTGWLVMNVATVDSAGTWFVTGVHLNGIPRPLEADTDFTLRGKSALQYLWLAVTIACALFSLGTAAFVAFRSGMARRWRWAAAALVGVGGFSLNWATGEMAVRAVVVQLLSASAGRIGLVGPWILTFSLPLGAILTVERYRRWRTGRSETPDIPAGQATGGPTTPVPSPHTST